MPPLGLFMDAKSSSSDFTSAEELDSSNSGPPRGDADTGPVPRRRRGAGPGHRKGKNRDAARKSRKKQTAKADELHKEHQCLERSNKALVKEISSLRAEVRHYTAALERHEPSCTLLAASTPAPAPTPTPTPAPTPITAATRERGGARPSEAHCSPANPDPSGASGSPDRPRVSDVMSRPRWGPAPSSWPPRPPRAPQPPQPPLLPSFGAPSHRRATSGPGDPAAPSVTHAFALSTPVLTTSPLSDPGQLNDSFSSSCSSSSSSIIHLFNSHPLPSRVRPASFTPPHPAPPGPSLHFRSELESPGSWAAGGGPAAVLPPHSQGEPAPFYPYLTGYPIQGSPGSSSVHGYPTGPPGTVFPTMPPAPGPYRGFTPGDLLLPPDVFDHFDTLLPAASTATPGPTPGPTPSFSELMPTLWDLCSGDASLSQLLPPDDWYQDC